MGKKLIYLDKEKYTAENANSVGFCSTSLNIFFQLNKITTLKDQTLIKTLRETMIVEIIKKIMNISLNCLKSIILHRNYSFLGVAERYFTNSVIAALLKSTNTVNLECLFNHEEINRRMYFQHKASVTPV